MESNKTITLKRLEGGLYHINPVYIVNIRTVINNGPYYTEVHISDFSDSTLNTGYPTILLVKESLAEVAIKIAQALGFKGFDVNNVPSKKAEETILAEIKMAARAKATEAFSKATKIDDIITSTMKNEAEKIIRNYIESKPASSLDKIIENTIGGQIGKMLGRILYKDSPVED